MIDNGVQMDYSRQEDTTQTSSVHYNVQDEQPNRACGCKNGGFFVAVGVIILGLVLTILLCVAFPRLVQKKVDEGLADRYVPPPGSDLFKDWLDNDGPDDPVEYRIYHFYNLTNPYEWLHEGATAVTTEVGPFVFQHHSHKIDVNVGNGEASFKEWSYFTWVEETVYLDNSDGSSTAYTSLNPNTTYITMPNPILWGAAWQGYYNPYHSSTVQGSGDLCRKTLNTTEPITCLSMATFGTLSSILTKPYQSLADTRTANQWLGIMPNTAQPSNLLALGNAIVKHLKNADSNWGWFYNESKPTANEASLRWKPTIVSYDRDNWADAQKVKAWAGFREIKNYTSLTDVSQIIGVDDDQFFMGWGMDLDFSKEEFLLLVHTRPGLSKSYRPQFWLGAGARSVGVKFDHESSYKGVDVWRFIVDPESIGATALNRDMYFSQYGGLSNESQYKFYAPVHVSTPHFVGFEELVEKFDVQGLTPADPVKHATFADIEPNSGLVIRGAQRMQVNLLTPEWSYAAITLNYNVAPNKLIPALWFETRSQLTDSQAKDLRTMQTALAIKKYLIIGGAVGGSFFMLVGIVLLIRQIRKKRAHNQQVASQSSEPLLPAAGDSTAY